MHLDMPQQKRSRKPKREQKQASTQEPNILGQRTTVVREEDLAAAQVAEGGAEGLVHLNHPCCPKKHQQVVMHP